MIIPDQIRVGSTFYTVKAQATPIVMNGMQCYGYCDPNMHEILLDAGLISDEQTMEQTFCHELIHAMMFERKINLETWGLTMQQNGRKQKLMILLSRCRTNVQFSVLLTLVEQA